VQIKDLCSCAIKRNLSSFQKDRRKIRGGLLKEIKIRIDNRIEIRMDFLDT